MRQIESITSKRVKISNKHGIRYTIVSHTVPGFQGIADKATAEKHATEVNNYIANEIKDNRDRLGAFAALPMHDPFQAGNELRHCVKDRFPKLKIIVGHLGEHILFDFWRINHWLEDVEKLLAAKAGDIMCKKTIYDYFNTNIWVTTSGHFSTPTLKYVADYLGPERIPFSVDYPYETIENGCGWWDEKADEIKKALGGTKAYAKVGRENAKKLLRLGKFHDSEVKVE